MSYECTGSSEECNRMAVDAARITKERDTLHALMCVVELMEPGEGTNTIKVFRGSMPSLAHLWREDERGDAMYLDEAVKRAMDSLAAQPLATSEPR